MPALVQDHAVSRAALAATRAAAARAHLAACDLCAHSCGVDRRHGPAGRCHAGPEPRVFGAQIEVSDEVALAPTLAVAFSGCDLRCDFCITGAESWDARAGAPLDLDALAARIRRELAAGRVRTVMFLGGEPTIHLPAALALAARLPDDATLVWKTNAHASPAAHALLEGVFDVWVADYKFGCDACAQRLAHVAGYTAVVRENLRWARAHTRLIVRHLLMPGHVACCWRPVAEWLAAELPGVEVNLRTGFWPAWRSPRHPELRGVPTPHEADEAWAIARDLGLNLVP